ncbi:spore coat protein CotJB [Clostridium sp.]|jgi:spore coat protein JB|uniref:spore coat protein CotJB n=1 Tax=Clostridium sp. TaxID=1506 RepID=UPI003EED806B
MKNDMTRMELLKQITATRFIKVDLALFLNTHPMDREAIAKYNYYVMEGRALKESYEMNYGMLTQNECLSPYPWQWISEPWPWEYDANIKLEKGEV